MRRRRIDIMQQEAGQYNAGGVIKRAGPCYDRGETDFATWMINMRIPAALTAIAALLAASAAAPVSAQQSAAECAELEDDRARLECYDRFFSEAEDPGERAGEASRDADAASRSAASGDRRDSRRTGTSERAERREHAERAADAERTASRDRGSDGRSGSEPGTPEDSFGKDKKILELGGEEMSSTALGEFDFWERGQKIELDNGQVWEIVNSSSLYHKARNPKVTIEKGLFSSFHLHIDGVSKSLRVRRIR